MGGRRTGSIFTTDGNTVFIDDNSTPQKPPEENKRLDLLGYKRASGVGSCTVALPPLLMTPKDRV